MRHFCDTVDISDTRLTAGGYLVATARVARTGVQHYTGAQIDPDNALGVRDRARVAVYRSPESVFDASSLATYAHRPVTLNHPATFVTSDTWRDVAVGQTGEDVVRDGQFVRVPLVLMDAAAIKAVNGGTRQLSMGYSAEIKLVDGVSPDGEPYDAIQTDLRMNHLAVCRVARGGPELVIGDSKGHPKMPNRTIVIDSIPVDMDAQAAAIVERALATMQAALAAAEKALADLTSASAAETDKADKALAAKDTEIANLKKAHVGDAELDALVEARATLVTRAKQLADSVTVQGKTATAIRREVVAKVRGEDAVKDKSDVYVEAVFDMLSASPVDPVRAAVSAPKVTVADARSAEDAYAKSVARLNDYRKSGS